MIPRVSETGALTTVVLILIAVFAVVTVLGIIRGARFKAQRRQAERIERERVAAEGGDLTDAQDAPATLSDEDATDLPETRAAPGPAEASPAAHASAAPERLHDEPVAELPPGPLADAPVTQIKGLGPKVAARLDALGIATIGQLAALDDRAAQDLDAHLGPFTGRMERDRWREQARLLASGDVAGFERVFGRL